MELMTKAPRSDQALNFHRMRRCMSTHGAPQHFLQVFIEWAAQKSECNYGLGLSLLRSVVPTSGTMPEKPSHAIVEYDIIWHSEDDRCRLPEHAVVHGEQLSRTSR